MGVLDTEQEKIKSKKNKKKSWGVEGWNGLKGSKLENVNRHVLIAVSPDYCRGSESVWPSGKALGW